MPKTRISSTFNINIHDVSNGSAVSYFKEKQKIWLWVRDDKDLEMMYEVFRSGSEISLWCERSVAIMNQLVVLLANMHQSSEKDKNERLQIFVRI